nr:tRNA (adenosine(37)-N6)-threonylcarbamoyltransferase complex ATPase subunit type 1 TsaE [Halopseudomonas salegens]
MLALGAELGVALQGHGLVFLHGDLGAGKTTLSRGLIQSLGHRGAVKSPTYTLIEPYELGAVSLYHLDLYRLADPEELEFLGVRDFLDEHSLCLIEWPDKGAGFLPTADLTITIRMTDTGRKVAIQGQSPHGLAVCQRLNQAWGAK